MVSYVTCYNTISSVLYVYVIIGVDHKLLPSLTSHSSLSLFLLILSSCFPFSSYFFTIILCFKSFGFRSLWQFQFYNSFHADLVVLLVLVVLFSYNCVDMNITQEWEEQFRKFNLKYLQGDRTQHTINYIYWIPWLNRDTNFSILSFVMSSDGSYKEVVTYE